MNDVLTRQPRQFHENGLQRFLVPLVGAQSQFGDECMAGRTVRLVISDHGQVQRVQRSHHWEVAHDQVAPSSHQTYQPGLSQVGLPLTGGLWGKRQQPFDLLGVTDFRVEI